MNVGKGHTGKVWSVAFAPEGTLLASASADGTVKLWDPTANQEHDTLQPAFQAGGPLAFSPDGKLLALAGRDATVQLLDPKTWEVRRILRGHRDRIRRLAFSPDGRRVAASALDQTVRIWDVGSGSRHCWPRARASWLGWRSPRMALLAGGGDAAVLEVWDLATGQKRTIAHGSRSPQGPDVLAATASNWRAATASRSSAGTLPPERSGPRRPRRGPERLQVFSHDGRTLAGTQGTAADPRDLASPGEPIRVQGLRAGRRIPAWLSPRTTRSWRLATTSRCRFWTCPASRPDVLPGARQRDGCPCFRAGRQGPSTSPSAS